MSYLFDGVDDTVRWSIGSCNITGDWTLAFLIKLDTGVSWQSYLGTNVSGGASAVSAGRHSDGRIHAAHGGGAQFFSAAVTHSNSDGWMIGIVSKVAGNNQPIGSKFPIGGAWTHTTMSSLSGTPADPSSQAGGTVRFGEIDGSDFFKGRMAACALWKSALSQANKETLATLTRANWLSLSPDGLWDATDQFATDQTGNGATRTTLVGTTSDADDPAGWASWAASADPYVGAGAAATASSGNVTPALPGSLATGDALILDVTALDNVSCSVAVSGGSGNAWTLKGAQNNGTGLRKEVWWKRRGAGDTDTAAAVAHTGGGKIIARVHAIRVPGTGDPFEAFSFDTISAASSGDFPDITTLSNDAVMMFGLGYAEDFVTGPSISAAAGLTLTEVDETEVA